MSTKYIYVGPAPRSVQHATCPSCRYENLKNGMIIATITNGATRNRTVGRTCGTTMLSWGAPANRTINPEILPNLDAKIIRLMGVGYTICGRVIIGVCDLCRNQSHERRIAIITQRTAIAVHAACGARAINLATRTTRLTGSELADMAIGWQQSSSHRMDTYAKLRTVQLYGDHTTDKEDD